MNLNLVRFFAVVAATAACVFSPSATVADVSYTIGGTSDLEQFNIQFKAPGATSATTYNNVYAGGIQISQPSGHSADGLPNNYISICTDFLGSLYAGKTYSYLGSPVSLSSATGTDPVWNNKSYAIANASYLFNTYGDLGSGGLGTGNKAGISVEDMAALQLAVWMVLYDTGSNGKVTVQSSSEFYISTASNSGKDTAAITLALGWVANLTGTYKNIDSILQPDSKVTYTWQSNPAQELLYSSVPEPATILAGVLLLLPLGVSTIRNLRLRKFQAK